MTEPTEPSPAEPTRVGHVLRDDFDLYVGGAAPAYGLAASPLANPFTLDRIGGREGMLRRYARSLAGRPDLLAMVPHLRGLTLACWCHTLGWRDDRTWWQASGDHPCHGDLLAFLADALPEGPPPAEAVPRLQALLADWPDAYAEQLARLRGERGR